MRMQIVSSDSEMLTMEYYSSCMESYFHPQRTVRRPDLTLLHLTLMTRIHSGSSTIVSVGVVRFTSTPLMFDRRNNGWASLYKHEIYLRLRLQR